VCLRPVRPGPLAWHEMPGWVARENLRPVGAVLRRSLWVWCAPGGGCGFGVACDVWVPGAVSGAGFAEVDGPSMRCCSVAGTWALVVGVAGLRLRTALTGRGVPAGADPGLHPGLVELALQAGIAGSGQWAVRSEK
jgi:hypothetical protein